MNFPPGWAMVQSVDFLTPIVNDPYGFGCIAAANALSDIYAMGGQPFSAMNIVCFPKDCMPLSVLTQVLRGGRDTVHRSGAVVAGGHTVEDQELKFGLAVTGQVREDRVATNGGARAGDRLLLTKPVGSGVLATAIKADMPGSQDLEDDLIRWAGRLNATAARVISRHGIAGATDVTGFGLGGHLLEMARAAGVHIHLSTPDIPLFAKARDLAAMGLVPAGTYANRSHCARETQISGEVDPILVDMVFDAQTSGGLVLAVPGAKVQQVRQDLQAQGDLAAVIGWVDSPDRSGIGLSLG